MALSASVTLRKVEPKQPPPSQNQVPQEKPSQNEAPKIDIKASLANMAKQSLLEKMKIELEDRVAAKEKKILER